MAINLGAMISAARSQRNPMGEFLGNNQRQGMVNELLSTAGGQETQPIQTNQNNGGLLQLLKAALGMEA